MTEPTPSLVVAVVDDDFRILQSVQCLLESADYSVCLFGSAAELLGSASLAQIDCLISDLDMPGTDGFELLQLLDVARPGLPIILITGFPERLERMPRVRRGPARVFTKPFQGEELLRAVSLALRR